MKHGVTEVQVDDSVWVRAHWHCQAGTCPQLEGNKIDKHFSRPATRSVIIRKPITICPEALPRPPAVLLLCASHATPPE